MGQGILDASLPQALVVARRTVRPIPVQALRSAASAPARLPDQRDVVEQGQRLKRVVPVMRTAKGTP